MAAVPNKLSMLVRGISTSPAVGQMVKAPVQVFGIEGRYAGALYSAASKQKELEAVERDLSQLQNAMKTNVKLRDTITSPIINKKVMAQTLAEASSASSFAASTKNLLALLAENGKLKKIDGVINSYRTIMAAHRGEVVCEVVTAKPLEAGQRKQLEATLKKFIKAKETIQLTARVDPALIGGMVVSIGDKYVDMSVASKIKKYTELIKAAA